MKLNYLLNNIGPIEKADIDLEDLTIIVGTNSIGKSLITKSAYIATKSLLSNDEQIVNLIKDEGYTPELYRADEGISLNMSLNDKTTLKLGFNPLKIKIMDKEKPIKDITYVDGPLIINENIPKNLGLDHNDDLKRKLISISEDELDYKNEYFDEILDLINEILENQDLEYSSEKRRFFLKVNNNMKVLINRAPNGIKSFLILRELLQNGYLNKDKVLILDEPEILSHAVWQLSLAHIIAKMIKNLGVKVIINTCSIYFIEALEMYSTSYQLKTNYYLGKKAEDRYIFINESNSIQNIYNALLDPFEKLDNLRMQYSKGE
ncbi:MAG: hypothetical protein PHQ32_02065 [Firmicutes bacterium]|nr:hypothetical protein [Bacillota bacterium]